MLASLLSLTALIIATASAFCDIQGEDVTAPYESFGGKLAGVESYVEFERGRMILDRLENGMRLLVIEIPSATVAYGAIAVKVGGRYEEEQYAGISHLLEHLLFKETDEHRPLGRIRQSGGLVNAVTDMELTTYHFTARPEHFESAMDALSSLVLEPRFDPADLEREREVVLEELAEGLNDPRAVVLTQLVKKIFPGSPMNSFVIGTKRSVGAITYDRVRSFFETYYVPANMIAVAAGRVNAVESLVQMESLFGPLDAAPVPGLVLDVPEPAINSLTKKIPINQSFYVYGALTPGKNEDVIYAMEVLDVLFGNGVNSRLHRSIVTEGGLTEQLYPNWFSYSNTGIWAVFLSLDREDMDHVAALIEREMAEIQRGAFSDAELAEAKRALISRVRIALDRPQDIAKFQLENLAYRDRILTLSEYVHTLDGVERRDIVDTARAYFSDDRTVTIEMKPAKGPGRWYLILKYLTTKTI
jgi:predicted Zn-dependent peptidase